MQNSIAIQKAEEIIRNISSLPLVTYIEIWYDANRNSTTLKGDMGMEKRLWIALCLCLLSTFSACSLSDSALTAEQKSDAAVQRAVYTDSSRPNSRISIAYPVLLQSGMEWVNADIADFAASLVTEVYGENASDLDLEIDYEIKRYDAAYLSIAFVGTGNVHTAAHPNNLFVTKNYDIQQNKEITLADICTVDTAFAEKVYAVIQQKVEENLYDGAETDSAAIMQTICPDTDALFRALLTCDRDITCCQSYLTPQAVGISLPVPHALGDHFEVEIPIENS